MGWRQTYRRRHGRPPTAHGSGRVWCVPDPLPVHAFSILTLLDPLDGLAVLSESSTPSILGRFDRQYTRCRGSGSSPSLTRTPPYQLLQPPPLTCRQKVPFRRTPEPLHLRQAVVGSTLPPRKTPSGTRSFLTSLPPRLLPLGGRPRPSRLRSPLNHCSLPAGRSTRSSTSTSLHSRRRQSPLRPHNLRPSAEDVRPPLVLPRRPPSLPPHRRPADSRRQHQQPHNPLRRRGRRGSCLSLYKLNFDKSPTTTSCGRLSTNHRPTFPILSPIPLLARRRGTFSGKPEAIG